MVARTESDCRLFVLALLSFFVVLGIVVVAVGFFIRGYSSMILFLFLLEFFLKSSPSAVFRSNLLLEYSYLNTIWYCTSGAGCCCTPCHVHPAVTGPAVGEPRQPLLHFTPRARDVLQLQVQAFRCVSVGGSGSGWRTATTTFATRCAGSQVHV
jgi:hypothetical protein